MRVAFTGHRSLFNYNSKALEYKEIYKRVYVILKTLGPFEYLDVDLGGALGFDTAMFYLFRGLRDKGLPIRIKICVPFRDQPSRWRYSQKLAYQDMLDTADEVVYVDTIEPYSCEPYNVYRPVKMQRRNRYMVDDSSLLISCWNGSKSGTYNCIEYALSKGKRVININPYSYETEELVKEDLVWLNQV